MTELHSNQNVKGVILKPRELPYLEDLTEEENTELELKQK